MSARDDDYQDSDSDLWQAYAQRVQRTSSHKRRPVAQPLKSSPKTAALTLHELTALSHRTTAQRHATHLSSPDATTITTLTFDRKIERQLRDGSFAIEARLDLHGMTQTQAHSALARFIAVQRKLGHRKLLVITGKGRGREGVLRNNLVTWLETLDEAPNILTVRTASMRHGGDGAFYVLLKKAKAK